MDPQQRDSLLARWVVARGLCTTEAVAACQQRGLDLLAALTESGLLDAEGLARFEADLAAHAGTGNQSSGLRKLRLSASLPRAGEEFAGFQVEEELGRGGMGAVHRARRLLDGKAVALKLLLGGEVATEELKARFEREVATLRRLNHPGIVRVYEAGRERDIDYYAMDLLRGARALTAYLKATQATALQGAALLARCADALAYGHDQGIVHRDIKPDNLVIDQDGEPWVVDFGLARDLDRETRLTQSGTFLGTPTYMAPEQCLDAKSADARSDIYALGAVLYEVLTERPPFRADTLSVLMAEIVNRPPDRPSSISKVVHPGLEAVCLKALRKRPEDRYPSASAFAEDLRRAIAGARTLAQRERRGRTAGVIAGALLLALLGAGAAALTLGSRAGRSGLIGDAELEERARRIEPILEAREQQLRARESFAIDDLVRELELPPNARFESGRPPRSFRLLLGRLARLEGELYLRLSRPEQAKGALLKAQALLANSALERRLDGLSGLLAAEAQGREEEAVRLLTRAFDSEAQRGDLRLALAHVQARLKRFDLALECLERATALGFDDLPLRLECLSALALHEPAVALLEKNPSLAQRPRDAAPFLALALETLDRKLTKRALELAEAGLNLEPEAPRRETFRVALWKRIEDSVRRPFKVFKDLSETRPLLDLGAFLDRHFPKGAVPKELPEALSSHAINVDGMEGMEADQCAFLLCERAALWAPEDPIVWLRFSSEKIWDQIDAVGRGRLMADVEPALKSAKTPRDLVCLRFQFLMLFAKCAAHERALELFPQPTAKDLKDFPVEASEILYWRAKSFQGLKRDDEAIASLQLAIEFGTVRLRSAYSNLGGLLAAKGRRDEAFRAYAECLRQFEPKANAGKWREPLVEIFVQAGPDDQARLDQVIAVLAERGPGPAWTAVARAWAAARRNRPEDAARALDEVLASPLSNAARDFFLALKRNVIALPRDKLEPMFKLAFNNL